MKRPSFTTILLVFILLLAAALRVYRISSQSLWPDEIFTLQASAGHGLEHQRLTNAGLLVDPPDLLTLDHAGPWWNVATSLARDDNHPPLYFLVVRLWRHVWGDSPTALRGLSAVVSVASVWLLYDAVRIGLGRATALWSALLMAVAGPQIQFAQEARAYALLVLLGLGALDALIRIEREESAERDAPSPRSRWGRFVALGACVLGMMLSHYYAIAPAAVIGVYSVIRLRGRTRTRALVALAAAAVLFCVIWGPSAWHQRQNIEGNNWWNIDSRPEHVRHTWLGFALLPVRFLAEPLMRSESPAAAGAVLYLLPLILLRRRPALLIWWLWLIVPAGMVLIMDLSRTTRQVEYLRYTIAASPAVYALLAAMLGDSQRRWLRHLPPAAAVLTCVYTLPVAYNTTLTPKPDWRLPAALIEREAQSDDIALFFGSSDKDPGFTGIHYLALRYYAKKLPHTVIFIARRPDDVVMQRLRAASGVWMIVPREVDLPENYLPGFTEGPHEWTFGLPRVQRWTPPPKTRL